jgi:hypothetical protein
MRDLLGEPLAIWDEERRRTLDGGLVARMLEHRRPGGDWPKGRWTGSVWALLLLVLCGLPEDHAGVRSDTERMLVRLMPDAKVDGPPCSNESTFATWDFGSASARIFWRTTSAPSTARCDCSECAAGRRRLELPRAATAQHDSQLVPYDVQRAREPSGRRGAGCRGSRPIPGCRGPRIGVHARPTGCIGPTRPAR